MTVPEILSFRHYLLPVPKYYLNTSPDDIDGEIWKPVPKYEGMYEVSNLGRVKSLPRFKRKNSGGYVAKTIILSQMPCRGYLISTFSKPGFLRKNYQIHNLVIKLFHGESDLQSDHIDDNKLNNCAYNLQYLTARDNSHKRKFKKKTSKYLGVHKCNGKWRVTIYIDGKNKHLGYFTNEEDAGNAFITALNKLPQ